MRRQDLAKDQLTEATTALAGDEAGDLNSALQAADGDDDSPQPDHAKADKAAGDTRGMRQSWVQLTQKFNSVPPPSECKDLANTYDQVLRETGAMMSDIIDAIELASNDRTAALKKLYGMLGKSGSHIDEPAKRSDGMVSDICNKYATTKWFSITADVGDSSMLSGAGGLGIPGLGGG